jgi:ubiquinone/menaquinone biosynthesis C-methylase UbiE
MPASSASVPNHFAVPGVARRYAAGRPYVHDVVAAEIVRHAGRLGRAVDIGAGTGLSTRALLRCAATVIGVDPSIEMLGTAFRNPAAQYVGGVAETLPLASGSFDLATVSAAFHWCNHDALFSELERVIRPGGWIAIYDVELATVVESPSLVEWLRSDYWPSLPRCTHFGAFDAASHVRAPFALVAETNERAALPMSADDIVAFVLSQASSINAMSTGFASIDSLEKRLRRAMASALPRALAATVVFDVPFSLLRRR